MATMHDVVTFFLRKGGGRLDPKQVQKLPYYAEAWHYVWSGEHLLKGRFQAWVHGPVYRQIWDIAKTQTTTCAELGHDVVVSARPEDEPLALTEYQVKVLESVWAKYGHMSGDELEKLSHDEAPWRHARGGLPEDAKSNKEIDPVTIRNFYAMQQLSDPENAPVPVRPSREERLERSSQAVFDRHSRLFAELAK